MKKPPISRTGILLALLLTAAAGLGSPLWAEEIPTDFTPFVRLAHLVKASVYKDPVLAKDKKKIIQKGTLVKENIVPMPAGSGTVISRDGLILTNYHVYQMEERIQYNEKNKTLLLASRAGKSMLVYCLKDNDPLKVPVFQYIAEPVSLDKSHDTALLKIERDQAGQPLTDARFSHVTFGNPFAMKLNENITIIGYPRKGGETITVTEGKFLGYYRSQHFPGLDGFIKTNAAMAPGNSGGSSLNKGGLVGVPTAVTLPTSAGSDLGYIHPITWALKVLTIARHKYGLETPDIPVQWLETEYNTDETLDHIYMIGHILSAQSRQSLSASVIIARHDRTLTQIKNLHLDLQSVRNTYIIQRLHDEGLSPQEISERFKISQKKIEKILKNKWTRENMSPDTLEYIEGKFFYSTSHSDDRGFFILPIPRGKKVRLYINKSGYRSISRELVADSGTWQDLGDILIYQY